VSRGYLVGSPGYFFWGYFVAEYLEYFRVFWRNARFSKGELICFPKSTFGREKIFDRGREGGTRLTLSLSFIFYLYQSSVILRTIFAFFTSFPKISNQQITINRGTSRHYAVFAILLRYPSSFFYHILPHRMFSQYRAPQFLQNNRQVLTIIGTRSVVACKTVAYGSAPNGP